MAISMGVKRLLRTLFAVFFLLLIPFRGVYGSAGQQSKPTMKTLRDTNAELENDPRASLPSMFTICVSVLVRAHHNNPRLFTLLGKDGSRWFDVQIQPLRQFFGKRFLYKKFNRFGKIDTFPVFPNQWARSCLSLNTVTGSVQWVARGELVDSLFFCRRIPNIHIIVIVIESFNTSCHWCSIRSFMALYTLSNNGRDFAIAGHSH